MNRTLLRRLAPLILLAGIEGVWCVFLGATRRIPSAHDGFQYFYLKYYFFNEFVQYGELPQWLPYLTHGSPAAWWYVVQSGMFDPIGFWVARLLHVGRFIPVFYALLFVEKLLLMTGVWLLASVHVTSRAVRFAATASIVFTSIWYTQAWWNFHAFLALPMMLFLLDRTLRQFQWTWLTGLGLLLFLQTFGQLSYYLPMTLLFLAAYAGLLLARADVRNALRRKFYISVPGVLTVALPCSALLVELLWLRRSSQEIAFGTSQRSADGSVPLWTFLSYGGSMDLRPAIQLFASFSPHLDFTTFAGFLIAGLTIVAVMNLPWTTGQRFFGGLTLITVLLATSSPLAVFVFYFWPLGRLFRHLSLLMPVAKMFCVFFAAVTFDRLVRERVSVRMRGAIAVSIVFAGWSGLLIWFGINPASRETFVRALTESALPPVPDYSSLIGPLFAFRAAAFSVLSWLALVALLRSKERTARIERLAWIAAIVLCADAVTYSVQEASARMIALPEREAVLFDASPLPYAERRSAITDDLDSPRRRAFSKTAARIAGARYWAEGLLWFTDAYNPSRQAVLWSASFESLLRAMRQQQAFAKLGIGDALQLPVDHPLLREIGGLRQPKIRFFRQAMVCSDVDATTIAMADPSHRGQIAVLTTPSKESIPAGIEILPCEMDSFLKPSEPPAQASSATIAAFSSNRAEFVVDNATDAPLVLTYSDTWNDHWQSRVEGTESPVFRSDLAYKAVVVPPGRTRVSFTYRDVMAEVVFALQGAASVGLLVFLGILTVRLSREPIADAQTSTAS